MSDLTRMPELTGALDWFIHIDPWTEVKRIDAGATSHSPIFKAQSERITASGVSEPSAVESVYLSLLPTKFASVGVEIKNRFMKLVDDLDSWRIEAAEAIERWHWEHARIELPDNLYAVFDQHLIDRREAMRIEAEAIVRLCEIVAQPSEEDQETIRTSDAKKMLGCQDKALQAWAKELGIATVGRGRWRRSDIERIRIRKG